jgi:MoaA/NifB/PqqE/SkfB family radical SAM enzyme
LRGISTPEGMFFYDRDTGKCLFTNTRKAPKWLKPLYAQIALTEKCNLNCWHCYSSSSPNRIREWPLDQLKRLVKFFDAWHIFGVAFGGGEPFMYSHLCEIAKYTWLHTGLDVSITTNGYAAEEKQINQIEGYVSEIRVSVRSLEACSTLEKFLNRKFEVGVNLLLHRGNTTTLDGIIKESVSRGVKDFLLNSFVAVGRGVTHQQRMPSNEDYVELAKTIRKHMGKGGVTFKVSGRLAANLQPYLDGKFLPFQSEKRGRIVSITADGKVKPSSMSEEAYAFKKEAEIVAIYQNKIAI